jgi:hypothetical protein
VRKIGVLNGVPRLVQDLCVTEFDELKLGLQSFEIVGLQSGEKPVGSVRIIRRG